MAVMRIAALLLAVCLVGPCCVASPMATELTSGTVEVDVYSSHETEDNGDNSSSETDQSTTTKTTQLDPWSLVWYIGSFGGLVAFFLAVSCSECCCHRPSAAAPAPVNAAGALGSAAGGDSAVELPPPPPYSLFAPPPYDSLVYAAAAPLQEKDRLAVFVVPVPVHGVVSHPP